jgi:exocyst complex component 2
MSSPGGSSSNQIPLLPANSNSLIAAQYLIKVLGEIQDCVYEVNVMEISNDAFVGLKDMMESLRWRFIDILTHTWLRGESACSGRCPSS